MANTTTIMQREHHHQLHGTSPRFAVPAIGPSDATVTDPAAPTNPAPKQPGPSREPRANRHVAIADGSKPNRRPARARHAASGNHHRFVADGLNPASNRPSLSPEPWPDRRLTVADSS